MLKDDTNKMMKEWIQKDIVQKYNGKKDISEAVEKCLNHIECLGCMDTHKILLESESYFGGTYEEFSCPICTGYKNRLDSHHQIYHSHVNGRQVPYNGGDSKVDYSRVNHLYNIYKQEYEKNDILLEEKKKEAEIKNCKLIAEENEKNKPLWEFMDSKELQKEINSIDINVNINDLINDVSLLLASTAGNLLSLPSFLKGLNVSLKYYWDNESATNSSFYKTKDDKDETIYIKFEYNKKIVNKNGGFGIFRMKGSSNKEYLNIIYFIAKPKNEAAEKICTNLMNKTIQSIIDKINK